MRAFVTCDGEPVQIEVWQEAELLEAFKEALIDFGKTSASCSGICQASDVSNFFKASKKRVRSMYTEDYVDEAVQEEIMTILTAMNVSSEKKRIICDALQIVSRAVQDTLTISCVQHGYERCGQYPIDFDKTMAKCTSMRKVSKIQCAEMKANVPHFVKIFRQKGELTEKDLDEKNIYTVLDSRQKAKDERVLYQQRAVLMNKEETISKFKIYKSKKQIAVEEKAAKAAAREKRKLQTPMAVAKAVNEPKPKKARSIQDRNATR